MKVFFTAALRMDGDGDVVAAFVLASDTQDAVRRLRRHAAFANCAIPPEALVEYEDDDAAIERLAGARSIIDRLRQDGFYLIRDVALAGG